MTDQITVPRETWGALREALEKSRSARTYSERIEAHECAVLALTAANAVSHQKPETTPAPEGGAITAENDDADMLTIAYMDGFDAGKKSVKPIGWYCVSRDGLATQCADQRDAEVTAESANRDWPKSAPYRAVQLCELEANPQATEPAPSTYEPIGWADWQGNMVTAFRQWSDKSSEEIVFYRKLPAAPEAKQ